MLNHIVLMGRLTRDPELRRTGSGVAVASFTLAVDRDFAAQGAEKETDFVDIVAWRNTAEFVSRYFTKGRMAVVTGRLQIRNWTDKEGNKRRSQRSWQTMSTSATPSAMAPLPAVSTRRRLTRRRPPIRLRQILRPLRPASPCSKTTIPSFRSDRLFPNECFHKTR